MRTELIRIVNEKRGVSSELDKIGDGRIATAFRQFEEKEQEFNKLNALHKAKSEQFNKAKTRLDELRGLDLSCQRLLGDNFEDIVSDAEKQLRAHRATLYSLKRSLNSVKCIKEMKKITWQQYVRKKEELTLKLASLNEQQNKLQKEQIADERIQIPTPVQEDSEKKGEEEERTGPRTSIASKGTNTQKCIFDLTPNQLRVEYRAPTPQYAGSGFQSNIHAQRQALPNFPKLPDLVNCEKHETLLAALLPALDKFSCLHGPIKRKRSPWVRAFCDLHHPAGPWGMNKFLNVKDLEASKSKKYSFKSYVVPKIYEHLKKYDGTSQVHKDLLEKLKDFYETRESYYRSFMEACEKIAQSELDKPVNERAAIPTSAAQLESVAATGTSSAAPDSNAGNHLDASVDETVQKRQRTEAAVEIQEKAFSSISQTEPSTVTQIERDGNTITSKSPSDYHQMGIVNAYNIDDDTDTVFSQDRQPVEEGEASQVDKPSGFNFFPPSMKDTTDDNGCVQVNGGDALTNPHLNLKNDIGDRSTPKVITPPSFSVTNTTTGKKYTSTKQAIQKKREEFVSLLKVRKDLGKDTLTDKICININSEIEKLDGELFELILSGNY